MKKEIRTKGFFIIYNGEPEVGIPHTEWKIEGDFIFESEEEFKTFEYELLKTWELISDTPLYIQTFEERQEEYKKENEYLYGDSYLNNSQ